MSFDSITSRDGNLVGATNFDLHLREAKHISYTSVHNLFPLPDEKPVLVTSIAPPLNASRSELDTNKLEWLYLCLDSWHSSGHYVISVNCKEEVDVLSQIVDNVDFRIAPRTTQPVNVRPLVFISDMLSAAKRESITLT